MKETHKLSIQSAASILLAPCPKSYSLDQDKARSPRQTLEQVQSRLAQLPLSVLATTRRIDNGRLGIPVYLSICGNDARQVMPTRKQMGKGVSPEQAEASALMELMERYGFFTFWQDPPNAVTATWSEAEELFGEDLMPIEEVIKACHDSISPEQGRQIMNLRSWLFVPALRIADQRLIQAPLDLFKTLGEFNGSSAGNTDVESLLQGACELVERHVCCLADRERPQLPSIDSGNDSLQDPVLIDLFNKFRQQGIEVLLKDFSLSMPIPTVAALAFDPANFPQCSEIVFTAGTASSPAKAAIRALTEVAQLAGDFNTRACYEASGLPKFSRLADCEHLREGALVPLSSLPCLASDDIFTELQSLALRLHDQGYSLYAVSTTNPDTRVPSHYSFVPGFHFRERDANPSLGLFVGRLISEQESPDMAEKAQDLLEVIYPMAHFAPFFRGMIALRTGRHDAARAFFARAEELQRDAESQSLAAFYHAYTYTLNGEWEHALPGLDRAVALSPDMKEYRNLRGVCLFKMCRYAQAADEFQDILTRLDKGSVMDIQNLGLCYKKLGNLPLARHYLSAALELDPALGTAKEHLAELDGAHAGKAPPQGDAAC